MSFRTVDGSWIKSDAELDTYGLWLSWEGAHPVSQVHTEASALQGAVGGCEGDRTVANVGEGEGMGDHQTIHHIAKVQLECRECGPEGRVELQVTPIVLSQQLLCCNISPWSGRLSAHSSHLVRVFLSHFNHHQSFYLTLQVMWRHQQLRVGWGVQ